jgi:Tfp pilus assembly protein PilX
MMRQAARQKGIALPVMLIMLAVMMISTVYLLRSTNSTTMMASNLAYENSLSKAADLGIHRAYQWLNSRVNRNELWVNVPAAGYVATANPDPAQGVSNPAFWNGAVTIAPTAENPNTIQYVIHRMCMEQGAYNTATNNCVQTAARQKVQAKTRMGDSLSSDAPAYQGKPQLHYVITTRISGPRGGNVMNQAVVMMGP